MVRITICCGTYCHVMGGSELQLFGDFIPDELKDSIDFRFSTCLGYCNNNNGNPPFADVNGKCIPEATNEKLLVELKKCVNQQ
ncbi:MAG: hypothetical protein ACOC0C_04100 [Bacteroidota bacterium]